MSTNKAVPEGLKNQEWAKGNRKKCPPIPYVPVSDKVQEAVLKGKDFSYKIKLPNKTKFSVPIWDTGTQEAFLIHMQQSSKTTMTPLRQKRSLWNKSRASERLLQTQ